MMKRLLAATAATAAAGTCLAAVTLVPTLTAPAELQVGDYEVYQLSVRNSGSTGATNVVIRMNLAPGMTPAGPWPSICSVVSQDFECRPGSIPARKSRDHFIVFKAPTTQQTFAHTLTATGTSAATAVSAPVVTDYRYFNIPISGNANDLWEVRSCSGGTSGVAYNLCPASSEVVGDAKLHAGGVMEDLLYGQSGTWLQNSPHDLRLDTPAGSGYDAWYATLTAVNSKCFRGAGQTVPSVVGQPVYRTANKICRK